MNASTSPSRPPFAGVSLEGVNGVGKTYLAAQAIQRLGSESVPLAELPDSDSYTLAGKVITAMRSTGDLFLRTGHPRTEALLLVALQVHRHEAAAVRPGQVLLEDRGPHSAAIYQAAILAEADHVDDAHALRLAEDILTNIARWRPLPQTTLLLRDDPARCLLRFERRLGRFATADERALMTRVDRLYEQMADTYPSRFRIIDRRHDDEHTAVAAIVDACRHTAAAVKEITPCPT